MSTPRPHDRSWRHGGGPSRRWCSSRRSSPCFVRVGGDWDWLVALGDDIRAAMHVPDGVPFAASDTAGWHNVPVLAQLARLRRPRPRRAGNRARARGRGRRHHVRAGPHGAVRRRERPLHRWRADRAGGRGAGDPGHRASADALAGAVRAAARPHREPGPPTRTDGSGGRSRSSRCGATCTGPRCSGCACSAPTWSSNASARTSGWPRPSACRACSRCAPRPQLWRTPTLLRRGVRQRVGPAGRGAVGPAQPRHALRRGAWSCPPPSSSRCSCAHVGSRGSTSRCWVCAWPPRAQPGTARGCSCSSWSSPGAAVPREGAQEGARRGPGRPPPGPARGPRRRHPAGGRPADRRRARRRGAGRPARRGRRGRAGGGRRCGPGSGAPVGVPGGRGGDAVGGEPARRVQPPGAGRLPRLPRRRRRAQRSPSQALTWWWRRRVRRRPTSCPGTRPSSHATAGRPGPATSGAEAGGPTSPRRHRGRCRWPLSPFGT